MSDPTNTKKAEIDTQADKPPKIIYNGKTVRGEKLDDGWVSVSVKDVKGPAVGDIVRVDGADLYVIDELKGKRRPTLAPPRTHWRLPVTNTKPVEEKSDKKEKRP